MKDKKIIIECEIQERWINDFISMLKKIEYQGNIGHSGIVGIYADGDGDFRPKFNVNCDYKIKKPVKENNNEIIYDAITSS